MWVEAHTPEVLVVEEGQQQSCICRYNSLMQREEENNARLSRCCSSEPGLNAAVTRAGLIPPRMPSASPTIATFTTTTIPRTITTITPTPNTATLLTVTNVNIAASAITTATTSTSSINAVTSISNTNLSLHRH
ncbi:hypothetical protein TREES_T100008771 [Tupaia chinensis]|uniref:Uncharacterized protein n=1 Tax=Tupaia chinensis TaxID=246437 RepID=L9L0U1_TUPCH|nr:hypothetical protein TREES_T100008771 [Tupaia chinensis]